MERLAGPQPKIALGELMVTVNMETVSTHDEQQPQPHHSLRARAHLFKFLSDETRLRVIHFLLERGELHVRALCDLLEQSQPAVSHHLALLRDAKLIDSRRDGKHNFYRVTDPKVEKLLALVAESQRDESLTSISRGIEDSSLDSNE